MDILAQLSVEFERIGEAEVAERLNANRYKGQERAVALRWLNDRTLAKVGSKPTVHALIDPMPGRVAHAEQTGGLAVLCALVALLTALGSLGVSVHTLQAIDGLARKAAAPAPAAPAP